MDKSSAIKLQTKLGVKVDGAIGKNTLIALFKFMGAKTQAATELGTAAAEHFVKYGILDQPSNLCHFMGQAAHESGGFFYTEEIASGKAYEGRKDLGNTVAGYGVKYKGRGIFQLTGAANYLIYERKTGLPLFSQPELAAERGNSVLIACIYWNDRKCNVPANANNVLGVTKKINGGKNGLADRINLTNKCLKLFDLNLLEAA